MEFGEMVYWWHRDWDEMYVTHTHDTLTFWARQTREHAQNGDLFYDHVYNLSIMITGFAEPFDNCEVNTVTYHHTWNGSNPDPMVEAYNLDHADTKDGHYQERNHQYVGSTRDIGLVEVHFNIR